MNLKSNRKRKPNTTKRERAAHGITRWIYGRIGRQLLVVLILVSSLFGMVGFAAVPTADDGGTAAENPVVTAVPTAESTADPTPTPDAEPTPEPTAVPTTEPTAEPTPTQEPIATPEPTVEPTAEPTPTPDAEPTPDPEPTPDAETEIPITLHIILAPDAEEECVPFTVPAGSSLDLIINGSVLYSLTGGADTYSAEGETVTEPEQTEQTGTWEWYTLDADGGKVPYDLSAPITAPLDVYAARTVAATAAVETKTVKFYIALNGEWLELSNKAITVSTTASFSGVERYYIKYSDLVKVYKDYDSGLVNRPYSGGLFFPHRDDNSPQEIWADVAPMEATDGSNDYWIPLGGTNYSDRQTYYVYYTPGNDSESSTYFNSSKKLTDEALLAANSFYTVEVNSNGKVDYTYMQYYFSGGSAVVELPALNDASAEWTVHNSDGGALKTTECTVTKDETTGKTTIALSSITEHVIISAIGNDFEIVYNAVISKEYLSQNFPADSQTVSVDGSVQGKTEYAVLVPKDENYRVLATDSDRASVIISNNNKPRTVFYTFKHWKIDGTDVTVVPGTVLTPEQLTKYAGENGVVTLKAVWTPFEQTESGAKLIATANFYVCYDCEIASNFGSGYTPPTEQHNFTNAVYSARVFGTTSATSTNANFNVVEVLNENTAAKADSTIRSLTRVPVSGLTLEGLPSDETVLSALRAGSEKVHVGGTLIDHEYLTSDHFTVRWYAFKYEHSDGYHVDGVLVAKAARLVVTKTFTGSTEVINAVTQQDFKINVVHNSSTGSGGSNAVVVVPDYTLRLKPEKDTSLAEGETGYKSYDPVTNTYTWVLDGYQNQKYTITEEGGGIPDEYAGEYSQTVRYTVRNPNQQTVTPVSGWNTYDEASGVTVTVASYANDISDDAVQTVALENMYVKTGTITVAKRDSVTGNGIAGVEFELSMENPPEGVDFRLYHKPNSSQYSSDVQEAGYTDAVEDNVVATGGNGYFYLKLDGGHTYTLTERVPLGYNGAASVTFTVGADGTITNVSETCYKDDQGNEIKLPSGSWAKADGAVLSIDNLSHVLTEVKVKCNWGGSAADQKDVTVQLWRSGAPMVGEEYTVTLKADSAEEWAYVWHDLPLFADGKLAEYTVRVTYIGDVAYDANIPGVADGYENYDITFDNNLYKNGAQSAYDHETGYWTDEDGSTVFADHVLIHLNIEPVSGKLALRKVSDTIGGATLTGVEFTLYSDANCVSPVETAVSDDGEVEFAAKLAAGTYYLKETKALAGYALNDTVYRVRVHAGIATVTAVGGDGTEVHTVVNKTSQTLIINKVNQYDSPVPGAKFTLTRIRDYDGEEEGRNDSPVYTSDEYGRIVIDGLERGTYCLTETAAPNGYKPLETEFKFIVADGRISLPAGMAAPEGWVLSGSREGGYMLTVTNQALYVFPTTGGVGIYAPIALGAALMCTSAVLIIKRKRETA